MQLLAVYTHHVFVNQAAIGGKRNRELVTIVLSISYLIILSRLLVKIYRMT